MAEPTGAESWLLVASRARAPHTRPLWRDAAALGRAGHDVSLVLTDDAVVDAVAGTAMSAPGVRVLVDADAARRRGVLAAPGVRDRLVERGDLARLLLDPGVRTVWR